MPDPSKPVPVSLVLQIIAKGPGLAQESREAIREGIEPPKYNPHRSCPCRRCHEYYGTLPR